jgi:hypothetical protein
MSLFRTRDLWQVSCGTDEEFDQGSLCVGNVTNDPDGARESGHKSPLAQSGEGG